MYAVIETGGKQYRVAPGGVIAVERLPGSVGDVVELSRVLLVGEGEEVKVGAPSSQGRRCARLLWRRRGAPRSWFSSSSGGESTGARPDTARR